MKTIKQLADELGVSKQAVRKQIAKLPPTMLSTGVNRTTLINDDGVRIIYDSVSTKPQTVTTNQVPTVDTMVDMLQRELDSKNALIESQSRQLENKDKQIGELTAALENTTASLHAAQALHSGTMAELKVLQEPMTSTPEAPEVVEVSANEQSASPEPAQELVQPPITSDWYVPQKPLPWHKKVWNWFVDFRKE